MAKVISPLFSLGASGKLANSLVYMKWKGIDDVRMWLKPANPRTAAQQSQRTKMRNAVNTFHSTAWNSADITAFNFKASTLPQPMSGFNYFIQQHIATEIAGKTWYSLYQCQISGISQNSATVTIKCAADKSAKLYLGSSKSSQPNEISGTYASGTWTFSITNLQSGVTYYFYIKNTATGAGGITGLYSFTTT